MPSKPCPRPALLATILEPHTYNAKIKNWTYFYNNLWISRFIHTKGKIFSLIFSFFFLFELQIIRWNNQIYFGAPTQVKNRVNYYPQNTPYTQKVHFWNFPGAVPRNPLAEYLTWSLAHFFWPGPPNPLIRHWSSLFNSELCFNLDCQIWPGFMFKDHCLSMKCSSSDISFDVRYMILNRDKKKRF